MIKITDKLISRLANKAKTAKRGRVNYNFHKDYSEKVQRLLNVAGQGSYVRPHKHENPDKTETFILLKGKVLVLEFGLDRKVSDYFILDLQKGNLGVEISPGVWHSFISLSEGSCVYEVKEGPYNPKIDKKFAPWAPQERSKEAGLFNKKILSDLNIK